MTLSLVSNHLSAQEVAISITVVWSGRGNYQDGGLGGLATDHQQHLTLPLITKKLQTNNPFWGSLMLTKTEMESN